MLAHSTSVWTVEDYLRIDLWVFKIGALCPRISYYKSAGI